MKFTEDFENVEEWSHHVTVYPVDGGNPYRSEVGNIFVPPDWEFAYWHGLPVAHDPSNDVGWAQPEGRYVHAADFDYRVYSGEHAWMYFGFYRIVHAILIRSFQVMPGQAISASAWAHAWSSNVDDPRDSSDGIITGNVRFRIGIDPTANTDIRAASIVWSAPQQIYDTYEQIRIDNVQALGGWVTLFVRGLCLYPLKHNDFYVDRIELWTDDAPVWYPPRMDYHKEYFLLPGDATQEQHRKVADIAFERGVTVGFSADDAGIGPPKRKVRAYWCSEKSWSSKPDVQHFFDTYYPGVILDQIDIYDDTGTPPVEPPEPPDKDPSVLRNPVGLHVIEPAASWEEYVKDTKPRFMKVFQPSQALTVKQLSPETKTVWRFFVDNDGWYACNDAAGAPERANQLFGWYWDAGLKSPDVAAAIDFVESVNEVIGTFSGCTPNAVAFDAAFAERVHTQFPEDSVATVGLTIPVGNPHETEFELLLPAVDALCRYHGAVGYHGYWTATKGANWLAEKWPYHAGRWCEMDKVFTAHGLYPLYTLGEVGIVYSTDGDNMNSGKGWRSCGDIANYIAQIDQYADLITQWNDTHNGRCLGGVLFTTGGWGWDNFRIEGGDLLALSDWARGKYGA